MRAIPTLLAESLGLGRTSEACEYRYQNPPGTIDVPNRHLGCQAESSAFIRLSFQDLREGLPQASTCKVGEIAPEQLCACQLVVVVRAFMQRRNLIVHSLEIPRVSVEPGDQVDVVGVLARRAQVAILPSDEFERDQGGEGDDQCFGIAGKAESLRGIEDFLESEKAHDLGLLRRPGDRAVFSFQTAERHEVDERSVPVSESMRDPRVWSIEFTLEQSFGDRVVLIPVPALDREIEVACPPPGGEAVQMHQPQVSADGARDEHPGTRALCRALNCLDDLSERAELGIG